MLFCSCKNITHIVVAFAFFLLVANSPACLNREKASPKRFFGIISVFPIIGAAAFSELFEMAFALICFLHSQKSFQRVPCWLPSIIFRCLKIFNFASHLSRLEYIHRLQKKY